jgi:hypothetical protein
MAFVSVTCGVQHDQKILLLKYLLPQLLFLIFVADCCTTLPWLLSNNAAWLVLPTEMDVAETICQEVCCGSQCQPLLGHRKASTLSPPALGKQLTCTETLQVACWTAIAAVLIAGHERSTTQFLLIESLPAGWCNAARN